MWSRSLALALFLLPAAALAGVKENVAALAPQGLVLVMDARGNELVAQNIDEPFVPASVTKIVTAWLAMEVLGGDYRFKTRFYLDDKRVLYVRGGGDPFLISEELEQLATKLVAAVGKKRITGIVLDASYYPSNLRIPGIEDTHEAYVRLPCVIPPLPARLYRPALAPEQYRMEQAAGAAVHEALLARRTVHQPPPSIGLKRDRDNVSKSRGRAHIC
jgi:D-alanyl-D-alanine carboxypeptidase